MHNSWYCSKFLLWLFVVLLVLKSVLYYFFTLWLASHILLNKSIHSAMDGELTMKTGLLKRLPHKCLLLFTLLMHNFLYYLVVIMSSIIGIETKFYMFCYLWQASHALLNVNMVIKIVFIAFLFVFDFLNLHTIIS